MSKSRILKEYISFSELKLILNNQFEDSSILDTNSISFKYNQNTQ